MAKLRRSGRLPIPAGLWTHLGAGAGLGDGCASGSGVGATPVPWVQAHLDARYARRRSQEEHSYGTSTEMGPLAVVHLAPGRAVEQVARRIGSPTDADKFLGTYERRSEYASYLTAMITPE